MNVANVASWIGYTSPVLLGFMAIVWLRDWPLYLKWFVGGVMFNNLVNIGLKWLIREPRPLNQQDKEQRWGEHDEYGMPSAHSQNAAFIVAFLFDSVLMKHTWALLVCIALLLSTMIQRYLTHNHTMSQILIGCAIGLTLGYLTQSMARKWINGRFRMKPTVEPDAPLTTF